MLKKEIAGGDVPGSKHVTHVHYCFETVPGAAARTLDGARFTLELPWPVSPPQ